MTICTDAKQDTQGVIEQHINFNVQKYRYINLNIHNRQQFDNSCVTFCVLTAGNVWLVTKALILI